MNKYGKFLRWSPAALAICLASSGAANAAYITVATDTLTFDDDIRAFTSTDWGSCAESATGCTPSPSASLKYTVKQELVTVNGDEIYKWRYEYDWFGVDKALSHLIIEVSDNFTAADIIAATNFNDGGLDTYGPTTQGGSNPFMPSDMLGIKWNAIGNVTSYSVYIETYRAPEWGDFYAVDGKKPGEEVYAFNIGFGNPDTDPTLDVKKLLTAWTDSDYVRNHLMVPDTKVTNGGGGGGAVPEPMSLALFGIGLVGLGLARRRAAR